MQLPQEVIGQCFGFGDALGGTAGLVVVETAAAARAGPLQFVLRPIVIALGRRGFFALGFFSGRGRRGFHRGVAGRMRGFVGPFQQWIGFHCFGDFHFQLGGGHLQ